MIIEETVTEFRVPKFVLWVGKWGNQRVRGKKKMKKLSVIVES